MVATAPRIRSMIPVVKVLPKEPHAALCYDQRSPVSSVSQGQPLAGEGWGEGAERPP